MRGYFITLEGIEGCGKTTQSRRLADELTRAGRRVHRAREPGGTPLAEALRGLLLGPEHAGMAPEAELLMYAAARADHVRAVLRPRLEEGTDVVCDRFDDSTLAYQGAARGLDAELVRRANDIATGGLRPDATLLLDLPAEQGLERARRRLGAEAPGSAASQEGRFEAEALSFHRRVRSGFLRLAKAEPRRLWVLDASGDEDDVASRVVRALRRALPGLLPEDA